MYIILYSCVNVHNPNHTYVNITYVPPLIPSVKIGNYSPNKNLEGTARLKCWAIGKII